MALVLNTAPTIEPVSVAEVKAHLRLDEDFSEDLTGIIAAARQDCEAFHGRTYLTTTWEFWLDAWPAKDYIELPRPPLQSVTSVKYYGTDDTEYTFSSSYYLVDLKSEPGRVCLNDSQTWPSTNIRPRNGICVTYAAGYTQASSVPWSWKQAILLMIGHLYENREAVVVGQTAVPVPLGVKDLLWKDRVKGFK